MIELIIETIEIIAPLLILFQAEKTLLVVLRKKLKEVVVSLLHRFAQPVVLEHSVRKLMKQDFSLQLIITCIKFWCCQYFEINQLWMQQRLIISGKLKKPWSQRQSRNFYNVLPSDIHVLCLYRLYYWIKYDQCKMKCWPVDSRNFY